MNAILIVFIPAGDGQRLAERAVVVPNVETVQRHFDVNNAKTPLRAASNHEQTIPPFWTWFVENPRSRGA